ncbi:MAG: heavy-metal-associated domain-containing protein [Myxococcota bacterium]|nr:heavy-metal-associated domain-containing protein [Myxococcota bacterium]
MFRYVFLAAGLFYAQSAIACPMADAAAFAEAAAKVAQAEGTKATYKIEGMTCGSCSEKVATVVNAVEGVLLSAVDYQTGRIEIAFDSQKTNLAKLEAALAGTGYKITEKPQA